METTTWSRKLFFKQLLALVIPIVLQNLISAVVNTADTFMLATVGEAHLSASSLAGQITFILMLFHFGLCTGVSVLSAQYWGRKDTKTIGKVQGMALRYLIIVSLVFTLACQVMPGTLMHIFSADPEVIALGSDYLRFVSIGYLAMSVSAVLLTAMKSIEQTKTSAWITVTCLLTNIVLNAVSIFILFPSDPRLALIGVAAATSIARFLELALCFIVHAKGKGVRSSTASILKTEKWLRADFWHCTGFAQANYLIWGGATAAIAAIVGHLGSSLVAANSIASTVRSLVFIGCSGFGTAGSILLGKELGQDHFETAKKIGHEIFVFSLVFGAISGLLLLALIKPSMMIARLSEESSRYLIRMMFIGSVYCIGNSFNASLVSGVFCAGGDTRFGLICDTIAMWGVIIPIGLLAGFVWKLAPMIVYLLVSMDEIIKMPFVAWHFKKHGWLKNLTREITSE